jgi:hypothetical protein
MRMMPSSLGSTNGGRGKSSGSRLRTAAQSSQLAARRGGGYSLEPSSVQRPKCTTTGVSQCPAKSFSEETFQLGSERLRVDHVCLAFEGPTLRPRDARGDCIRGVIEG